MTQVRTYAIFHLNLAFSSVDEEEHLDVVTRCYWPLLRLIEDGIPLGLEMTAYTLEAISAVDPQWTALFRTLLDTNRCELIASGDSQIIGPLVPAEVNHHNLRLGQNAYADQLGHTPRIAYINEQAASAGLLDIYLDAGFETVVLEWDNPYSHNPDWQGEWLHRPQRLQTASGRTIRVIWNHAIAFQKFQRYAHGEMTLEDYLTYLQRVTQPDCQAFPVYGSDAEVFDFRPGRYHTEAETITGEWARIGELFHALSASPRFCLTCPRDLVPVFNDQPALRLTTAEHPVSVKKQAKYNISRWAVSGRNDLRLNSLCYAKLAKLRGGSTTDAEWRGLCRLWASDLRTHLTDSRYNRLALPDLPTCTRRPGPQQELPADTLITFDEVRRRLTISTPHLHLTLNANRGLAMESLGFARQDFHPLLGTVSHGYFDHISYGADFYSNHLVMERFRHRDRVTDLNRVDYDLSGHGDTLTIRCQQDTRQGTLRKWYRIDKESVSCGFGFDNSLRPEASLRLGFLTLLDCQQRACYATHLGGHSIETFQIQNDVDQGVPVSSIVSANSLLGATEGEMRFGTPGHGARLTWDPAQCAALPMISSTQIRQSYLNRMWFSLIEADETLKEGGQLLDFEFCITPCDMPKRVST